MSPAHNAELLRAIIEGTADVVFVKDQDGRYLLMNSTAAQLLGRNFEDIVGRRDEDFFTPEVVARIKQDDTRVLADGTPRTFEETFLLNGQHRMFVTTKAAYRNERGEIAGLVGIARDVTQHKLAEEALQRHHNLLHAVFEGTSDAVFVKDLSGRYLMANHAVSRVVGRPQTEVIGRRDCDLFPADVAERIMADDRTVIECGALKVFERTLTVNGCERVYSSTKAPYRDHHGEIIGLVGISHDITELKRAEQALRESESRALERLAELEHVYATAPIGLALHGTDLRILRISERLANIDGLSVAEHIGRRLDEILPHVAQVVEPVVSRVIQTGEPVLDVELETATPVRPWMAALVSLHPLKSADGVVRAVSVGVQDISERRRAEKALQESEERISCILESAMDAIITIDDDRRVTLFNAAAEDVFRCKAADVLGQPLDRLMSPALRGALDDCMRAFGRIGVRKRYMWAPQGLTAKRADGTEFPIEATLSQAEAADRRYFTIILRDVHDRQRAEEMLRRLEMENLYLREQSGSDAGFEDLVGTSLAVRKVIDAVKMVAATDSTVLITGETGTGKELVARAIHNLSRRADKMLVKVNCAALPAGLIESELFGHEKGAFTGALARKIGRFEMAHEGTIFLDEIGDLPPELQAKLLRVLQEGEFERVGGSATLRVDARVIAATNRDLAADVASQRFRADLYFRLNVFPIRVPPLRERTEDIPLLVRHFTMKYAKRMAKRIETIEPATLQHLSNYPWPGNIRELQNVVERAVIISRGPRLELGDWPPMPIPAEIDASPMTLVERERQHILKVLSLTNWRVSGDKGAARILGLKPTTLEARMKNHRIARPQ